MAIFYIMLASILGVLIFFVIIIFNFDNKDRHNKTVFKYSVKLCCFFMILHNSVFTIPVYQSLFNMLICQAGKKYSLSVDSCYKGVHLANSLLAVAGLIIFFVELLFINLFIHEMNPNSKLPSASFNLNQNALRTIYKLFFCLFSVLDHSGEFRQFVVIGGVVVLFLNLFFFRLNYPPLYNKLVNKLLIFLDAFLLYMYLILIIQIVGPDSPVRRHQLRQRADRLRLHHSRHHPRAGLHQLSLEDEDEQDHQADGQRPEEPRRRHRLLRDDDPTHQEQRPCRRLHEAAGHLQSQLCLLRQSSHR